MKNPMEAREQLHRILDDIINGRESSIDNARKRLQEVMRSAHLEMEEMFRQAAETPNRLLDDLPWVAHNGAGMTYEPRTSLPGCCE